jgi:hypothetical protein
MIVSELLSGIAAKLAGAGLAKAGAGLTMAAMSVTGAGAAGVLPEPAQNGVATVIEAVSPLDIPGGKGEEKKKDVAEADPVEAEENEEANENENNDFGERVSADAQDGGVDGSVISEEARERAEERRAQNAGTTGLDRARETKAAPHVPASVPAGRSTADAHKPSGTGSADTADQVRPEQGENPSSVADEHQPVETPAGSSSTADDNKPSEVPPSGAGRR